MPVLTTANAAKAPVSAIAKEPLFDQLPLLAHPHLLLDAPGWERLRQLVKTDAHAADVKQDLVRRLEHFLDPASEDYCDYQERRDPRWKQRAGLGLVSLPLELASFLYGLTGEARYLEFARGLVFAVIDHKLADQAYQMEMPAFHTSEPYPGWRHGAGHDFGGFSVALGIFYDLCRETLSSAQRAQFVAYAQENLDIARGMASEIGRMGLNNRGSRCAIGNALLALAIYEEADRDKVRYAILIGLRLAGAYSSYSFDIDGGSFEGASYCINASCMIALLGKAMARRGGRDVSLHAHLRYLPEFVLYNLAPKHDQILPINDCFRDLPPYGALVYSTITRNPVYRWLYDELGRMLQFESYKRLEKSLFDLLFYDPTISAVHPRDAGYPLAKHFRERGVVSMLSSWEADAAQAIFFCGPQVYGGHRQEDQNSFTFCALGRAFAWDAGYDNLAGVYGDRAYRRSEYHNTVLIDGMGQAGYDLAYWPHGHIACFEHRAGWTYSVGDGRRCYGLHGVIARADRHLLLRRGKVPYLLVVDDLQADDLPHDFQWNFVAHPHVAIKAQAAGRYRLQHEEAAVDLHLCAASDGKQGKLSWRQDLGGTMPRLQATQRGVKTRFAALLLPQGSKLGRTSWKVRWHADRVEIDLSLGAICEKVVISLDRRDRGENDVPLAGAPQQTLPRIQTEKAPAPRRKGTAGRTKSKRK